MMDEVIIPDATNSSIQALPLGVIHTPSHLQFFLFLSLLFILLNATNDTRCAFINSNYISSSHKGYEGGSNITVIREKEQRLKM